MKSTAKHLNITAWALAALFLLPRAARTEEKPEALETLVNIMRGKGFDTEPFLSHPKFRLYENIDDFFRNSAESRGIAPYLRAKREGKPAEAERLFREEYEKYKARIDFDGKKKKMEDFIAEYGSQLESSEKRYGVPKEITASVIGVESWYGKVTGKYYAFNVYVSMYVKNYRRKFALEQLEELLRFSRRRKIDVFDLKSSYAGAIGAMQFLPYSLNRWFVGEDVSDMHDTISSVANYLAYFKKRRGSMRKAVFAYNPSRLYVETVFELAEYARSIGGSGD